MAVKDALGDRMKEYYENRSKTYLTRRTPCILRLDGVHFHSYTKNFMRPYDEVFHKSMNDTLLYLCKNIQGCKIGYTQSDEITLLLRDDDKLTTDAWFDYSVQKLCSVAASMATLEFNRAFAKYSYEWWNQHAAIDPTDHSEVFDVDYGDEIYRAYLRAKDIGATFDCRAFNIPESEIQNCIVWRQQDATRNAIQMLGQAHFSHKTLENKSNNDIQDMLFLEKGINFNDMPTDFKRGVCCIRKEVPCVDRLIGYKKEWVIDTEIPIFTQNPSYIENAIKVATNS